MSQDTSKAQKTLKLRIMEILDPATDGDPGGGGNADGYCAGMQASVPA